METDGEGVRIVPSVAWEASTAPFPFLPCNLCLIPNSTRFRPLLSMFEQFRHGVVECVYESRPMAEDHKAPTDELGGRNII